MARQTKRLSARFVDSKATPPGMYADGDGLYLIVGPTGAKRWTFIFQWLGKRTEMGLGSVASRSLADAREAAAEARGLVAKGENPIEARRQKREAIRTTGTDFGTFADALVDSLAPQFRSQKHIDQWRMTLQVYAARLRPMHPRDIDTAAVLGVLKPLWQSRPETASRLRGRLERVLDAAKVEGLRSGENPARWRGHLDALLPKRQKLTRGHHKAMPYADLPAFAAKLATVQGMGALALRFLILTAKRTSEVTGATWEEIDLPGKLWTIPAERMKSAREHREPLTDEALAILQVLHDRRTDEFVFPGFKLHAPISSGTMTKALKIAGAGAFTVHGFRSTFRDWVGETTNFPERLAEAALAHVIGDETERAYRRGDALVKRRKLMEAWERYCLSPVRDNVVAIGGKRAG
jgi:integrase